MKGAYIIDVELNHDDRGSFGRTYCHREFEEHGLDARIVQCNVSFNQKRGTVRGMHYQASPYQETKLIRCSRGAMYDVIVDVRRNSPTFGQWIGVELTADSGASPRMVYVPEGFAHGFQTLADETEVFYQMSAVYAPEAARGFRWDDPAFDIRWPEPVRVISDRDRTYPDFVTGSTIVS